MSAISTETCVIEVRRMVVMHGKRPETNLPALQRAVAILEWVAANGAEIKAALAHLEQIKIKAPVAGLLASFPGAKIVGIRQLGEAANATS